MPCSKLEHLHSELVTKENSQGGREELHTQPSRLLCLIFAKFVSPNRPKDANEDLEEASQKAASQQYIIWVGQREAALAQRDWTHNGSQHVTRLEISINKGGSDRPKHEPQKHYAPQKTILCVRFAQILPDHDCARGHHPMVNIYDQVHEEGQEEKENYVALIHIIWQVVGVTLWWAIFLLTVKFVGNILFTLLKISLVCYNFWVPSID